MGRTLALRKCEEHEDCQLQSLNGGEWQHTPATTPLARRLSAKPEEIEVLEAKLADAVGEAIDLRARMGERLAFLDTQLNHLGELLGKLARVEGLYTAVRELGSRHDADLRKTNGRLEALNHDITKEREERIQGTAKTQRQFGEVMRHIG